MQIETFVEIENCQGYKISNFGNIIGIRGKNYKLHPNHKGYLMFRAPCRNYSASVHRIVAHHFIDGDKDLQVNHIDGNKLNNNSTNLEYISCKDNIEHAIKLGLRTRRSNLLSGAKFTSSQIQIIRDCINEGFSNKEISRYFKCHHSTISKIKIGVNYSSII